nr:MULTISPECIES: BrnT family toxin [unclassified Synechocystis]
MQFEWDLAEKKRNITKHGINFGEAATVFSDPLELTIADPDHSFNEMRWLSIAHSSKN